MCIRDRIYGSVTLTNSGTIKGIGTLQCDSPPVNSGIIAPCLLYTSDAADERSSVDLGGRRIIKKKNLSNHQGRRTE